MADRVTVQLLKWAAFSRIVVILLGILVHTLTPSYDTSSRIAYTSLSQTRLDHFITNHIKAFANWDSVFFLGIGDRGYEFLQEHAFFPLLPVTLRAVSSAVHSLLSPFVSVRPLMLLVGFLLCNGAFVLAVLMFFRLSLLVLKNQRLAYQSALFFCFTPASVFMSAVYTESIFALLSFLGLWLFFSGRRFSAALVLGLSSASRSNGSLYSLFFLCWAGERLFSLLGSRWLDRASDRKPWTLNLAMSALSVCVETVFYCALVCLPVWLFQLYGYMVYCSSGRADKPAFCSHLLPDIYSFVQSKYWNVGLFRYYQLHQIPNFLLAAPMLCLSIAGTYTYWKALWLRVRSSGAMALFGPHSVRAEDTSTQMASYSPHAFACSSSPSNLAPAQESSPSPSAAGDIVANRQTQSCSTERVSSLELPMPITRRGDRACNECKGEQPERASKPSERASEKPDRASNKKARTVSQEKTSQDPFLQGDSRLLPFLTHWTVLLLVSVTVLHVQVVTRFMSACPPVYWFMACLWERGCPVSGASGKTGSMRWRVMLLLWIGAYTVVGTSLFSTFYPWT